MTNLATPDVGAATRSRLEDSVETGRGQLYRARLVAAVLVAAAVLGLGLASDSTWRYGIALSVVYAIVILGNNAITGLLGEINLGAGAMLACGAYTTVVVHERGVSLELSIVAAVVVTTVVGFVLAIPTVRLEGVFTALVTFALAFALPDLVVQLDDLTGGHSGKPAPMGDTVLGIPASPSDPAWLVLMVGVFLLLAVVSLTLLHGTTGRRLLSVGESEPAAECFGMPARWWKVATWTFAAAHAGLAGAFFAITVGYLTPEVFPITLSIFLLVGTVVGGARSPIGALAGGLLVGLVPPELQSFLPPEATGVFFGLALFIMLFAGGKGVGGLTEVWASRLVLRARLGRKVRP